MLLFCYCILATNWKLKNQLFSQIIQKHEERRKSKKLLGNSDKLLKEMNLNIASGRKQQNLRAWGKYEAEETN